MSILVNNQLVFFPNGQRIIEAFIIQAEDLLNSVIINNENNISDILVVQPSALLIEHDEFFEQLKYIYIVQV